MGKKYTIIIKESARKQIKRLPSFYLKKISEVILGLKIIPGHTAPSNSRVVIMNSGLELGSIVFFTPFRMIC
jgi:mRNA-degrading endonuclease RelE of RelBE toxin-antitoxin system